MKKERKFLLDRIKVRHFPWVLSFVLVVLVTAAILFVWSAGTRSEQAMVRQVESQELTLARSGALSIAEYFGNRKTELLLLSQVESVKAIKEEKGREALKLLVKHFEEKGDLGDLVLVDKEGKVIWVVNAEDKREGEGVSVADRDYFLWAKEQEKPGRIFISDPLVARGGILEGKWVVVMATPIFDQNKFNGLVLVSFPLDDLTKKYVLSLVSSSEVQSLIVTERGTIVASTLPGLRGENFLQWVGGSKEAEKILKKIFAVKEGSLTHQSYFLSDQRIEVITAFVSLEINGTNWRLLIATPYEEAIKLARPFRLNQMGGLVLVLTGVLVLCLIFTIGVRIAQKEAFVDGFRDGRDEVKKTQRQS